jgi:hypothetical protein
VQNVTWDKNGAVKTEDYISYMEKETKSINWEYDFLYTTEEYQQLRQ